MGILSYLFGTASKHSGDLFTLPEDELDRIVSPSRISTLTLSEARVIEDQIKEARLPSGKISLRQIDQKLKSLEQAGKISQQDRQALMQAFRMFSAKPKQSDV